MSALPSVLGLKSENRHYYSWYEEAIIPTSQ